VENDEDVTTAVMDCPRMQEISSEKAIAERQQHVVAMGHGRRQPDRWSHRQSFVGTTSTEYR